MTLFSCRPKPRPTGLVIPRTTREITRIIIHCSATKPGWMDSLPFAARVAEIKRWHVKGNGWSDIGYHILISRKGVMALGRPLYRTGAHTKGKNDGSIGVCLIGGHGSASTDQPSDNFTVNQMQALADVVRELKGQYPKTKVHGHNEFAAKACPGFDVQKWIKEIDL